MNDDLVVAELARPFSPPPPPPSGRKVALAVVGCLGLFLLFVAVIVSAAGWGVWQVVRISREQSKVVAEKRQALQAQLAREDAASTDRSTEIVAAFSADEVGAPPDELAKLQALFDTLFAHKEEPASTPLGKQLVDLETFSERLFGWPEAARFKASDRREVEAELADAKLLSWLVDEFKIVHVVKADDGPTCTVYGYTGAGAGMEQRWLLTPFADSWRVADSELCDWGRWRSQLQANHMKTALETPATWQAFDRQTQLVRDASQLMQDGKMEEGLAALDRIRYTDVSPTLQNELRMRVLQFRNVPSAQRLKIANAFSDPEQWPGACFTKAQVQAELEQWPAALVAAAEYQRLVGPTASISSLLLPHYEELNDDAKCAELYRCMLPADPENGYRLAQLAEVTNDNAAEVIDRLRTSKQPADLACSVLSAIDADEHPAASAALLAFIEQLPGAAAKAHEVNGDLASRREDYAIAADHYRSAWKLAQDDAEQSEQLALRFLNSIIAAKQFNQRIDEVPDSLLLLRLAGEDYFNEQEIGVTKKQLRGLLAQARANHGDDVSVLAYDGMLLLAEKDYSAAEKQLLAALPMLSADDSAEATNFAIDRDRLAFDLAKACLFQNRVSEAYVLLPKSTENGVYGVMYLVQELQLASPEQRALASQLLSLHRTEAADDPANGIIEASILAAEDHYEAAWTALPKSVPQDRADLRWPWQSVATRLLLSDRIPLAGFLTCHPSEQISSGLAREFIEAEQWDRLAKLIVIGSRELPRDLRIDEWRMQSQYRRAAYEKNVSRYLPNAAKYAAKYREKNGAYSHPLRWLLLSLMKLQRYDEVLSLADEDAKASHRDNPWPIFVALARGDIDEAVRQAEKMPQLNGHQIYDDEELGYLVRSPAALPLRRVLPPSIRTTSRNDIELLLSDLPEWTAETLTATASKALGESVRLEPVTEVQLAPQANCWRAKNGEHEFLIFAGIRSSDSEQNDLTSDQIADDRLLQAWNTHQAWLAVVPQYKVFVAADEATRRNGKLGERLALAIAGERALTIQRLGKSKIILLDAAARKQLLTDDGEALDSNTLTAYLSFVPASTGDEPSVTNRRWKELMKHTKASPTEKPRVCVRIRQPGCWEDVWCRVDRVETKSRGLELVFITPERDSMLQPEIKAGEPYSAHRYFVKDFEYTAGGTTHRGLDKESPK